jgi:hypothetical protein
MVKPVLIIGSGAAASQAAQVLVDRGVMVCMIDAGENSKYSSDELTPESFVVYRGTRSNQSRLFLGDEYEGIPFGDLKSSNKLSPYKKHVISSEASKYVSSDDGFVLNQSLSLGGLAQGWGAGSMPLRSEDLEQYPISLEDLYPHYEALAKDIGVSGANDDLVSVIPAIGTLQEPLEIDNLATKLYRTYQKKRDKFNRLGIVAGRAWLAVCSKPLADRDQCQYLDLEMWGDPDRSVYRPQWTIESLQSSKNFSYMAGVKAISFEENSDSVLVKAQVISDGSFHTIEGRSLILAAGVSGSAKIVAESNQFWGEENSFPIRTNAHTYVPGICLPMLGKNYGSKRSSLAQLNILYSPDRHSSRLLYAGVYSYRSLLTFKLLKEAPLPFRLGLDLFRELLPSLTILNIFHSDEGTGDKRLWFDKDTEGIVHTRIKYQEDEKVFAKQNRDEKSLLRQIIKLGMLPLKRIRRQPGSSIHYSGTLPLSNEDKNFTCAPEGRLRPYDNVWVVDGSALVTMPSLLPTFTIMANARRVASNIADSLN